MPVDHKEKPFEAAIEDHLVGQGGWQKRPPKDYDRQLRLVPGDLFAFIEETQPKKWELLDKRHGSKVRERFLKRLISEIERRGTIDVLRHGVKDRGVTIDLAYFKPAHGLTPDLVARYEANRLTVMRQVPYSPESDNTVDLMLAVNGLPVASAELKNPLTGQDVSDAVNQYRWDRDPRDVCLSKRCVVHFAVDPYLVMMTTRIRGKETDFLPFNKGGLDGGKGNPPNPDGYDTSYLWEEVWEREAWLDILHRFIHIEREDPEAVRKPAANTKTKLIFPRYHQWGVVRKLEDDVVASGAGKNYLIMHSAGSGKSKSIGWLAHRLAVLFRSDEEKVFDKVIVVTDRVVLDNQLQDTIYQLEHQHGVVEGIDDKGSGSKSARLAEALGGKKAKIIVVTLQTFPFVLEHVSDLPERDYAVIIDEAHSSQTGETAKDMRAVLGAKKGAPDEELLAAAEEAEVDIEDPQDELVQAVRASGEARGRHENLSLFAFTATPKPKTVEMFGTPTGEVGKDGQPLKAPFHIYSMRQAIEEGFILDVLRHYVTYKTYFRLAKEAEDDPKVDKKKAGSAIAKYVTLHPHNIAQKVEIIVEHFRKHTAKKIGGRAKAMVVTRSRLHAVRYKRAIDAYIEANGYQDELATLVAFSGTVFDPDLPEEVNEFTESSMNQFPESQTAKKFDTDDFQVLIVAQKYQTGFDQPLLHTMFVDKKLEGVNAVQTLSRLNRTYPGKEDTFVLDFVNDAEQIREAFRPFYERVVGEATDPNKLYNAADELERFGVMHEDDVGDFLEVYFSVDRSDPSLHAKLYVHLEPAKDQFVELTEDDQEEFRAQLKRFVNMYGFLSQVIDYTDTDLERTYLYGRFLQRVLPRDQDGAFDLGEEVQLTHLRTEQTGEERDLSLDGGGGVVTAFTGEGTGSRYEPELEPLSAVIQRLNERFGTNLGEADRLKIESWGVHMSEDPELQKQAAANPMDNFKFAFRSKFIKAVVERMSKDEELTTRILDDEEFRVEVEKHLLPFVYERSRREATRGGTEKDTR